MITPNLLTALNEQHTRENVNRDAYRALSFALDAAGWKGSAAWMLRASNEEQEHADKFAQYIIDRGGQVDYVITSPATLASGEILPAFEYALNIEKTNTEAIKTLYYIAEAEQDPQTCSWLKWALDEQTDAEREIADILNMLRRLDDNGKVFFDHKLGKP